MEAVERVCVSGVKTEGSEIISVNMTEKVEEEEMKIGGDGRDCGVGGKTAKGWSLF